MTWTYLALTGLLLAVGVSLWAIGVHWDKVEKVDLASLGAGVLAAYGADTVHFAWSSWRPDPRFTLGITLPAGVPLEELVAVAGLMLFYSGFYVALGRRGRLARSAWPGLVLGALGAGAVWALLWGGPDLRYSQLVFARLALLGVLVWAIGRHSHWLLVSALLSAPAVVLWATAVYAIGVYQFGEGSLAGRGVVPWLMSPEEYAAIFLDAMLAPAVVELGRTLRARASVKGGRLWQSVRRPGT